MHHCNVFPATTHHYSIFITPNFKLERSVQNLQRTLIKLIPRDFIQEYIPKKSNCKRYHFENVDSFVNKSSRCRGIPRITHHLNFFLKSWIRWKSYR